MHSIFNPLNPELYPICHLLALLGAHHILHVGRIRVNTQLCLKNSYIFQCLKASNSVIPKLHACNFGVTAKFPVNKRKFTCLAAWRPSVLIWAFHGLSRYLQFLQSGCFCTPSHAFAAWCVSIRGHVDGTW